MPSLKQCFYKNYLFNVRLKQMCKYDETVNIDATEFNLQLEVDQGQFSL